MTGQTSQDRVVIAETAKGRGPPGCSELQHPVVDAVGGLMGYDHIGINGLEESNHLISFTPGAAVVLIIHHIPFRNAGCPDSIPGNFQPLDIVPVEVQVPFVQRSVFQVHVVVSR